MKSALEIAADHPAFAGHFPSFPVLPGAVLLDAVLAAVQETRGIDVTGWQVSFVKFLSVVRPGDVLAVEHEVHGVEMIRFAIHCQERKVMAGTLSRSTDVTTV